MGWLCMFWRHRWIWHVTIDSVGIYQCARCKTISVGAPRGEEKDGD